MQKMTNYLMNWREDVPSWLASYHPGDQVAFSDFMAGRVGYYPGSYFDGCLIKTANKAHCVHAFLYVDYGVTRERVEQELGKENALLGYHSIGRVEWPYDEILPMGGFQVPLGYIHRVRSRMCVNKGVQPFCIMQIFERNQDKDDSWGAERLALAYLFADGISTYYQLFVMKYNRAPWLFLLQDHGLGGNYDKYGKGGILDGVIHRYNVLPDFVIRDVRSTQMWDGYRPIEGVKTVIGGMHRNPRALYQRKSITDRVLLEADDECPYPYTQLDCIVEECAEQIGTISPEDLMRKTMSINEARLEGIVRESTSVDEVRNFNCIIDAQNNILNESDVDRMLQWLNNCDCAFISAFRNELKDVRDIDATFLGPNKDWKVGKQFTHEENRLKNKIMVAELLQLGYGVTKVKGVYPEGMTDESSEEIYLVVNRNNDENFLDNLLRISEYFNQDSIYYKEKGKTEGDLIGTNDCGWPAYHEKGDGSTQQINTASNYMLRLGNHAFSFVGKDSEKVKDLKEAMDSIERTRGTDDEWRQRHWRDNDSTTFRGCKQNRKDKMKEAVDFWRHMINGRMLIKEDIHPLTRKTMGEELRKMR